MNCKFVLRARAVGHDQALSLYLCWVFYCNENESIIRVHCDNRKKNRKKKKVVVYVCILIPVQKESLGFPVLNTSCVGFWEFLLIFFFSFFKARLFLHKSRLR